MYYKTENGTLYNENVLDVIKKFENESVNCCVTSPPYYGLRDYGLEPFIWGGDSDCTHKWGDDIIPAGWRCNESRKTKTLASKAILNRDKWQYSNFCQKCNAWKGQLGLEPFPELFIEHLRQIFSEIKRILKPDGTLWLNLSSSSAGARQSKGNFKPKDMIPIPWLAGLALLKDGWYLRQDIIWAKNNPMPESVKDRCTRSHEYILLLSKSKRYYYDIDSIREPHANNYIEERKSYNKKPVDTKYVDKSKYGGGGSGFVGHSGYYKADGTSLLHPLGKNKRSVWQVNTKGYKGAHFAVFPENLIEPCILAGCPENGVVIDPFFGSGTTGYVCELLNRKWIGIDANKDYCEIAKNRIKPIASSKNAFNLFFDNK